MKIEAGKSYQDRSGARRGPVGAKANGHPDQGYWHDNKGASWFSDGRMLTHKVSAGDLVSEWTDEPTGPVRERLVKEIVPGFYGIVCVGFRGGDKDKPEVSVAFAGHSADELRAAAATLLEIADALVKP